MLSSKRQRDILQLVRERGSCSISDLAENLAVTTETIRRNLKPLIDQGAVLKFHGGVMLPDPLAEPPYRGRMEVNREAKQRVAALVRERIRDGDSLFLDNGTTTTYVAEALAERSNLTIVTNSAEIACRLAPRGGNRVFMAGGEVNTDDVAVFGASALDFVRQFQVRYALLSVGGINLRGELVDFHLFEAEISRAAMEQAEETWVITDHTKFGRDAPVRVCDLEAVDLIVTDQAPPEAFQKRCAELGVGILTPGMVHA